jgi:hypothetical protein
MDRVSPDQNAPRTQHDHRVQVADVDAELQRVGAPAWWARCARTHPAPIRRSAGPAAIFRDKNRRDTGKSQSIWISSRRRPAAPPPCLATSAGCRWSIAHSHHALPLPLIIPAAATSGTKGPPASRHPTPEAALSGLQLPAPSCIAAAAANAATGEEPGLDRSPICGRVATAVRAHPPRQRGLPGRFHPQLLDKNRRDIGKISVNMDRFQAGNARRTQPPSPSRSPLASNKPTAPNAQDARERSPRIHQTPGWPSGVVLPTTSAPRREVSDQPATYQCIPAGFRTCVAPG